MRDFETIEACNEADPQVAMKFTGQRSFKHCANTPVLPQAKNC
jgi:hypothetical protein